MTEPHPSPTRQWRAARGRIRCGYRPNCLIEDDEPYLDVDGRHVRCQACAPEPVNWAEVEADRAGRAAGIAAGIAMAGVSSG